MQKEHFFIKKINGFSLVEVLLTVAIFTMTVLGIIAFLSSNDNNLKYSSQYNEANYYLSQGLEAVKNIKDSGYSGLNVGTFGLSEIGSTWQLTGTSDNINGFIRQITITQPDIYTKKATATITWYNANFVSQTVTASMYFKDWNRMGFSPSPTPTLTPTPVACLASSSVDITCDNDFTLYVNGTYIGQDNDWRTVHNYPITLRDGKNVVAVQGSGDFQTAQGLLAQINHGTTKFYTDTNWKVTNVYHDGWNTIDYDDSAWGDSVSYGSYGDAPWYTFSFPSDTLSKWIWTSGLLTDSPVYFRFEVNGCPTTPTPTITPTPTNTPTPTPTPIPVDWDVPTFVTDIDLSGTYGILEMVKQGDYIFGIRSSNSSNFFIMDVSDPANPVVSDYLSIGYTLTSIAVKDNTAYVTTTSNTNEMRLVDITNKSAAVLLTTPVFNLSGNEDGISVHVVGNRLYLGRAGSGTNPEFYLYNITTATSPVLLDSYDIAGTAQVSDVYVAGSYVYCATSLNSAELVVLNLTNESNITQSTSYNLTGNGTGQSISGYGAKLLISNNANMVYAFSIATPGAVTIQGSGYNAGGIVNDIEFNGNGNLAFLATSNTGAELRVLNTSNLASLSLYGTYNATGYNSYTDVVYDSATDRAYYGGNYTLQEFAVYRPGL